MMRMLIAGYYFVIRSERRLCEEVNLNLAYRWFCRLGLEGKVPDHSTFSKNRHGRFRESDLFRHLFEAVVQRCMDEGLVGGESFAVDASVIEADASRYHADTAYGMGKFLGCLAAQAMEPHIPVWDKGSREEGMFGRSDFIFDPELDQYTCPAGKSLRQFRRNYTVARTDSAHDGIRK